MSLDPAPAANSIDIAPCYYLAACIDTGAVPYGLVCTHIFTASVAD